MPTSQTAGPQAQPLQQAHKDKRRDIQGLRAIAVLLVVAVHAGLPLPGGFIGVDIFFVISGFVITSMLRRELTATGHIRLGRFYMKRAMRLLPALALMICITTLLGAALLSPFGIQQQTSLTGAAASVWSSNIALIKIDSNYFSVQSEMNPFLHTWSLGVEEQFYLIFPVLISALAIFGLRTRRQSPQTKDPWVSIMAVTIVTLGSFGLNLLMTYGRSNAVITQPSVFAFYSSPTRAWEFGIGAILAFISLSQSRLMRHARAFASGVGLTMIFTAAVFISAADPFPGFWALVPVIGTAMVITGGSGFDLTYANRALSSRILVALGDISYSWYLWHWPFIVLARRLFPSSGFAVTVGVIASLFAARLSYRYVERKYRSQPALLDRRRMSFLAALVIVPAMLCVLLYVGSQLQWGSPALAAASNQLMPRPIGYKDCLSDIPVSKRDLSPCTWGQERPGEPIYLMGDSNAQQYTEAVIEAGKLTNRPVVVATMGGCATVPVDTRLVVDPSQENSCRTWVADANQWIFNQRPGTVILASAGEGINDPEVSYRVPGQEWTADSNLKQAVWSQGITQEITYLKAAAHSVALVHVIPHFAGTTRPWWSPVECANSVALTQPDHCGPQSSLRQVQIDQAREFAAEATAASSTDTPTIDLRRELCPDNSCRAYSGGIWLYRDGLHISTVESSRLAKTFTAALKR